MITQDQLKEVQQRCEALNRYLDIPAKRMQYEEEQIRTQAPEFWEDQKRAEEQMKLVKGLEKWIKAYESVQTLADELATAFEFYKEELVTEEEVDEIYAKALGEIEDLELKNMLSSGFMDIIELSQDVSMVEMEVKQQIVCYSCSSKEICRCRFIKE